MLLLGQMIDWLFIKYVLALERLNVTPEKLDQWERNVERFIEESQEVLTFMLAALILAGPPYFVFCLMWDLLRP
jgi:hypothetical protein